MQLSNLHMTDQSMSDYKEYLRENHAYIFLFVHTKELISWTRQLWHYFYAGFFI